MGKSTLPLYNMLQAQVMLSPALPYHSSSTEGTRFLLPHPLLPPRARGMWFCTSALPRAIVFLSFVTDEKSVTSFPGADGRGVGIKGKLTNCSLWTVNLT